MSVNLMQSTVLIRLHASAAARAEMAPAILMAAAYGAEAGMHFGVVELLMCGCYITDAYFRAHHPQRVTGNATDADVVRSVNVSRSA